MKSIYAAIFSLLFSLSACAHEQAATQDHISVVGVGEVQAEPDQATLSISISALEPSLEKAKQVADQRYSKVLSVLTRHKIKDEFIKATQISAQPEYQWVDRKRIYKGDRVSRTLSVIVNDIDLVPSLMQGLVENDVSTINGVTTGFQDRSALFEKALAAAADNAREKAQFLATRLGRKLGSAYQISEHNTNAPQRAVANMRSASMAFDAGGEAPKEMFGQEKLSARINVHFNLL